MGISHITASSSAQNFFQNLVITFIAHEYAWVDALGGKMSEHSYFVSLATTLPMMLFTFDLLVKVKSSFTPECLATLACKETMP